MDEKLIARFWKKVDRKGPDECWLWKRATCVGYGVIKVPGEKRLVYAHRVSYELANGPIQPLPGKHGAVVMHGCDVRYAPNDLTYRRCCNPAHLSVGTQRDNLQDMSNKGRRRSGKSIKFPAEDVRALLEKFATGDYTQRQLAREYGMSSQYVSDLVHGRWRADLTYKDTAVQD